MRNHGTKGVISMLIGYDRSYLEVGIIKEIHADFQKYPMWAISGATGWG